MTRLYAQPYDISATGFYFATIEEYDRKVAACRNDFGDLVEEFEIQFIDGDEIDAALATAIGLHQGRIAAFLNGVEAWDDHQKRVVIIAAGECCYSFDPLDDDPDAFDVDLYPVETMREFAGYCVENGWFGPIPDALQCYSDLDSIARDLSVDYCETVIAGERCVYGRAAIYRATGRYRGKSACHPDHDRR